MTDETEEGAASAVPEPTVKYIKPNFKKRGVAFPLYVKIPQAIAAQSGIKRSLAIGKDDELPELVIDWMKADARYAWWFTKK